MNKQTTQNTGGFHMNNLRQMYYEQFSVMSKLAAANVEEARNVFEQRREELKAAEAELQHQREKMEEAEGKFKEISKLLRKSNPLKGDVRWSANILNAYVGAENQIKPAEEEWYAKREAMHTAGCVLESAKADLERLEAFLD